MGAIHDRSRWSPLSRAIHAIAHMRLGGNSGFSLIEVLVVIAVLGIVAAIVIMNITGFAGRSAVNAANTEAHQVQTAVIAYLEANKVSLSEFTVGDGSDVSKAIERYLLNPAQLQARYTVRDGEIVGASPYVDGRWSACCWDAQGGGWRRCE